MSKKILWLIPIALIVFFAYQLKNDAEKDKAEEIRAAAAFEAYKRENDLVSMDLNEFHNYYLSKTTAQRDMLVDSLKGKSVEWTGKVDNVEKGEVRVVVNKNISFYAQFSESDTQDLIELNRNQKVTIRGKLIRTGILANWIIGEAKIIK
ncbi:hypothetical protein NV379_04330 [Paenibacillus sp. N1-5-1-14]|uniref:hypothetical protein n=1 Tax=Paenibacillus radicibacter TaxID=2972488 RepID=UPI002158B3F0|nr:hypothetical protein [Paenibacillus radicibacter]MCR8641879.1 hypothetical protein [Paenibacillus radicibacter]